MKMAFFLYFLFGIFCFPSLTAVKKESAVERSIRLLNRNILTQRAADEEEELEMRDRNLKAERIAVFLIGHNNPVRLRDGLNRR